MNIKYVVGQNKRVPVHLACISVFYKYFENETGWSICNVPGQGP